MLQKRLLWYGGVTEAYWISSMGVAVRVRNTNKIIISHHYRYTELIMPLQSSFYILLLGIKNEVSPMSGIGGGRDAALR